MISWTWGICRSTCSTAGCAPRKATIGGRFHSKKVRRMHIQRVLEMCRGNRLRAAQILGIGRTSLYRYLKRDGYDTGQSQT
ncbi:MAG: hypothetical protein DMG38_00530 [Acidobacteria bacterium]|nr:MAG: hypothetical protein DMG38_00530 [Acidobacteriota bacterium]